MKQDPLRESLGWLGQESSWQPYMLSRHLLVLLRCAGADQRLAQWAAFVVPPDSHRPQAHPSADITAPALLPLCRQQVREAEHNIRTFKRLWAKAARLAAAGLDSFAATHDAMGLLEFLAADEQAAEDAAAAAAAAARPAVNATASA